MSNNEIYYKYISPRLPDTVLDFHTHVWRSDHWLKKPGDEMEHRDNDTGLFTAAKYVTCLTDYPFHTLMDDAGLSFPDKEYYAVCFGCPTPQADTGTTNSYVTSGAKEKADLFPLIVAGGGKIIPRELEMQLDTGGYFGYKVFLNWVGDDYKDIRVEDMLTEEEIEIANRRHLVVLLHVPRSGRLADPVVQAGVRKLAAACQNARIVLAHCGRCYHPFEMSRAIASVADLHNVYMDTSMVMEPIVIETAIRAMGAGRLVFGTDFPVAAMRGKRVNIGTHWVDVVGEGYPESQYRVPADNIPQLYMAQEIALAVIIAADAAGVSGKSLKDIFYNNGMEILERVKTSDKNASIIGIRL